MSTGTRSNSKSRTRSALPDTSRSDLHNYRLDKRVSQDGLATVYAATHEMLDRPVQVAILRRHDRVSASRFKLMAKLAGRLTHPHLLPVIDAGHDEQLGDYLIFPMLEARPLSDLLHKGRLEPVRALKIVEQIGGALDYLHSQQIIHRDVQPANILVTPQWLAYLTNLSLAAAPDGTPTDGDTDADLDYLTAYTAPEQHLDDGTATPTLDVYSLGAVAFHMFTGDLPPPPGTPLPPFGALLPDLAATEPVLRQMMAANPADRYATASAAVPPLRQALRVQVDEATPDLEESTWETTANWLENPLEVVLSDLLSQRVQRADDAPAALPGVDLAHDREALQAFEQFLNESRARANELHRANTVRRMLNQWSRDGFFRRRLLGRLLDLKQMSSYNLYFYELKVVYETRTLPRTRRRTPTLDDRTSQVTPPDVWEMDLPIDDELATVKAQTIVIPESVYVFACPQCGGNGRTECQTCRGRGEIERTQKIRNPDGTTTIEHLTKQCDTCRGYGLQDCDLCEGNGNLVEEQLFEWSRRARQFLTTDTDDFDDLPPRAVLERHTVPICTTTIDPYNGLWNSVPQLAELVQVAIEEVSDTQTRIVRTDLSLRGVPLTEVEYSLNDSAPRLLQIVGDERELHGARGDLYNMERVALAAVLAVLAVLAVVGVVVWLLLGG